MNRRNILLGSVAALGVGGWYLSGTRGASTVAFPDAPLPGAANAQTTDATEGAADTSGIVDMVEGNPDSPVEIIEYASFTCPHCAAFHAGPYKQLKADYIDTGKIRFVYREVYFDRFGLWASLVARCGGQEKFFGMTDLIYAGQAQWTARVIQQPLSKNFARSGVWQGWTMKHSKLACKTVSAQSRWSHGIRPTPKPTISTAHPALSSTARSIPTCAMRT